MGSPACSRTQKVRNMRRIIFIFTTLVLVMTACIKEKQTGNELVVGDHIPEFSVTLNNGRTVTSAHLSEDTSCIVFFHTSCPDCRETLPVIQDIYDKYEPEGIRFVLISREESVEDIESFWRDNSLTMPYSAQKDRSIYEKFAKTRIPRVYICQDGVIRKIYTDNPVPTYEELKNDLESY